jgi:hypothetical protein
VKPREAWFFPARRSSDVLDFSVCTDAVRLYLTIITFTLEIPFCNTMF